MVICYFTLFAISCPKTLSTTILEICYFFCSHIPSSALRIFWFFYPFGDYIFGWALILHTGFSFRKCSNHALTCRTLHTPGIVLKQDMHFLVEIVQNLTMFYPHSSMGDTPFMWNASSVKWHNTFSQWDLGNWTSITQHVLHLQHLRRLRYYTNEYPQKIIVVKVKAKVR